MINAGRRHNADPRWLLPLICRYGHVSRNEIGAIRIAASESYFEVTQRATPGFIKALRRATIAPEDQGMEACSAFCATSCTVALIWFMHWAAHSPTPP